MIEFLQYLTKLVYLRLISTIFALLQFKFKFSQNTHSLSHGVLGFWGFGVLGGILNIHFYS